MTVFIAIFMTEKYTLELEYIPLEGGAVEIVSAHIQPRAVTLFEQRHPGRRRGIVLDETEQHAEAMLPTARLEARQLDFLG